MPEYRKAALCQLPYGIYGKYGIYADDIPTLAVQLQDWEEDVVLALYADDSAYLSSSRRADLAVAKLQRVLDLLPHWLDQWCVAVNITKTAALFIGQQRIMAPKLRLRKQDVEWQIRILYLGVQINRSMHMAAQVEHVIRQSIAGRSILRSVLRSHLPLRAKVALYKGYICSRLMYAAPACASLAKCKISQTRTPMNSSGTSHRCTKGRRGADPSQRIHQNASSQKCRISDEKKPGHEATISPPSRTCDQERRSQTTHE
ncbi:RNA-directed DNA polymerase from mobile element jockey [Eumeta japonica]|uniref:RNA-directed DNA polymerase from mobile element jockey n=1 Tax=Eumeta variegata TaxID=151549 RepID=A0A4C1WPD5_EUMVA|nr:RNA-directed DNA polymerase from mobile element jockey [Eumeta japonica]